MWVHNGVCQGYNPTLAAPSAADPDTDPALLGTWLVPVGSSSHQRPR
jgi:hypothetical protein